MLDFWKSFGANALSGAASGITGSLLGLGNTAFAMRKGFNYAKKMFNLENQRQDYLLENADLIRKHSLERAGYSTADPAGTGTTAAAPAAMPSAPSGNLAIPSINSGSIRDLSSMRLQNSQADYYNVLANKEGTANELLKLDLQKYKDTYKTQVEQVSANLSRTLSEIGVNEKQIDQMTAQIDKFAAEIANINIDTKFNEESFVSRKSKIDAELKKLANEGDLLGIQKKLANYGIIVGLDGFSQLAALVMNGNVDKVLPHITKAITDIVSGLPSVVGGTVSGVVDTIIDTAQNAPEKIKAFLKEKYKDITGHEW